MKLKKILFVFISWLLITSCEQKEDALIPLESDEISVEEIDISGLNKEAIRYFGNMVTFVQLTTSEMDNSTLIGLKSAKNTDENSAPNPILDAFINIEIEDEYGNPISYFELNKEEREQFLNSWAIANANDMSSKLNDSIIGGDLEEYVQIQNDACDDVMTKYEKGSIGLKGANTLLKSNDLYYQISNEVQERIEEKSAFYSEAYLASNPDISNKPKGAIDFPDYFDPNEVLKQLRQHANRGDLLISLPKSIWLSAHLFYFNPLAITKYLGVGRYPPGHVSIVKQSKMNLTSSIYSDGVAISAHQDGVMDENVNKHWNCEAYICYVKKRKWVFKNFKGSFKTIYPNHDKVIAYAESMRDANKPYCKGVDFINAKNLTSCFICTTVAWHAFEREGFNIQRVSARWMPTVAPVDVYLSSNVQKKHTIK